MKLQTAALLSLLTAVQADEQAYGHKPKHGHGYEHKPSSYGGHHGKYGHHHHGYDNHHHHGYDNHHHHGYDNHHHHGYDNHHHHGYDNHHHHHGYDNHHHHHGYDNHHGYKGHHGHHGHHGYKPEPSNRCVVDNCNLNGDGHEAACNGHFAPLGQPCNNQNHVWCIAPRTKPNGTLVQCSSDTGDGVCYTLNNECGGSDPNPPSSGLGLWSECMVTANNPCADWSGYALSCQGFVNDDGSHSPLGAGMCQCATQECRTAFNNTGAPEYQGVEWSQCNATHPCRDGHGQTPGETPLRRLRCVFENDHYSQCKAE